MEATHFIEIWKYKNGGYDQTCEPWPIEDLETDLRETATFGHETIAVWRIKGTDVPLQQRLDLRRFGMGYGQFDDGIMYKADLSQYKRLAAKIENIRGHQKRETL